MRKVLIILGFITSLLAVILALTPLSNLAFIPAILAFLLGLSIFFVSKKQNKSKKVVQYIFLLTIITLGISIYKSVFHTVEVGNTEELQERAKESEENSKEILEELDIDEEDLEIEDIDLDTEEIDIEEVDDIEFE
ncbi:FUSC family protein [Mangrovimonas sp. DI 80]|uniref:FUSC family protein n=1 Tax=Mangrovimonas sp. DI 80 TaxID=1779330 RepID=UPI0009784E1D|nr:FUSC family protein [Mangrovimonas sp. DI 80]OMP29894.1 FUSC family protein [Mangrovimonas sp. DI 80]